MSHIQLTTRPDRINALINVRPARAVACRCRATRGRAVTFGQFGCMVMDDSYMHCRFCPLADQFLYAQSNFLEFMGPRRPPLRRLRGLPRRDTYSAPALSTLLWSMSCANAGSEGTGTSICVGKHANYGIRHVSGQAVIGPPVSSENSELKTLYQVLLCTSYPP